MVVIDFINSNKEFLEDFITRSTYHSNAIEFEKIHPFEDGNGRTGRLLINYELIKNNIPPVVISKDDRVKYFELLKNESVEEFATWLKELSNQEKSRMERFGYKN